MKLVHSMFSRVGEQKPANMTAEMFTKVFMSITAERYPSSDKILQRLNELGCETVHAKIIAITQLRNAVKEVSLNKIYRSVQHRDEVYMAIIEAAEELEDELEDLLAKEPEDDED